MNIIERQTNLGNSLFQINTSMVRELASKQLENVTRYFETNREFAGRIPEITSVTDYLGLQREYNETLWNSARSAVETQAGVIREALAGTRDAVATAFAATEAETGESDSEVSAEPKVSQVKEAAA